VEKLPKFGLCKIEHFTNETTEKTQNKCTFTWLRERTGSYVTGIKIGIKKTDNITIQKVSINAFASLLVLSKPSPYLKATESELGTPFSSYAM